MDGAGRQGGGARDALAKGLASKEPAKGRGIGLGILGVGPELEREKDISRVEFPPHRHGGRGGQAPGA